ncbi:MAG: sugar phosphate isomerase/epimerase [Synergistaceae bacterium]|nr:sugar phosphate isomerase/epimerase [Synergistaceae bacterium]
MDIRQKILPSVHLLEIFMPLRGDEGRMLEVLERAVEIGYYRGVELGVFFDRWRRLAVRRIVEKNDLNLTIFATPYLKDRGMNLNSPDEKLREASVEYALELVKLAAGQGCANLGFPSGDDPGDEKRRLAKECLAGSLNRLAAACGEYGMNLTLEPLDRYAFKKQLIGPMKESMEWFAPIHQRNPNAFVHWDSAHEALGGTEIAWSLEYAKPYIAQFHLCNAVTDPFHPCFGDLHMDVGAAPDYKTEGFLTPEVGAEIIRTIASYPKPDGVKNTYVSVEVLSHPGDDMWRKESVCRDFLQKCFALSGVE